MNRVFVDGCICICILALTEQVNSDCTDSDDDPLALALRSLCFLSELLLYTDEITPLCSISTQRNVLLIVC